MPLSYQSIKEILASKGMKVSAEAVGVFHNAYVKWARAIAEEATEIAKSYNRHTVLDRDVQLAVTRVAKRESI